MSETIWTFYELENNQLDIIRKYTCCFCAIYVSQNKATVSLRKGETRAVFSPWNAYSMPTIPLYKNIFCASRAVRVFSHVSISVRSGWIFFSSFRNSIGQRSVIFLICVKDLGSYWLALTNLAFSLSFPRSLSSRSLSSWATRNDNAIIHWKRKIAIWSIQGPPPDRGISDRARMMPNMATFPQLTTADALTITYPLLGGCFFESFTQGRRAALRTARSIFINKSAWQDWSVLNQYLLSKILSSFRGPTIWKMKTETNLGSNFISHFTGKALIRTSVGSVRLVQTCTGIAPILSILSIVTYLSPWYGEFLCPCRQSL